MNNRWNDARSVAAMTSRHAAAATRGSGCPIGTAVIIVTIKSAAPSIDTFFMNSAICTPRIIGSVTAQKLCIMSDTGTRNSTISQPPILAL